MTKIVSSRNFFWREHYCCVPLCHNSAGGHKERERLGAPRVSFHCFPDVNSSRGKEWIQKICRDHGRDFVVTKTTKIICSDHFISSDFVLDDQSLQGGRRRLKSSAVSSIFVWTKNNKRMSITSQKALQPLTLDYAMEQKHTFRGSRPL